MRSSCSGRIALSLIGIVLLLAMVPAAGTAAIPTTINYQGNLTDANGPVTGTMLMDFKIFNTLTGGAAIWTEQQSVPLTNGLFNVLLGSVTAINLPFDVQYYLEVNVFKAGSGFEAMTPRHTLTSTGTAFRAIKAESLSCAGCVTDAMVAAGGVTPKAHTHIEADIDSTIARDGEVAATFLTQANAAATYATQTALSTHASSTNNPHGTTAAQVGAVNKTGDTMTGALTLPSLISVGAGTAGRFEINNPVSADSALFTTTNGLGHALYSVNTGSHCAGHFMATNPTNPAAGIYVETDGLGHAGYFFINNATNANNAVAGWTVGAGNAVKGTTTGSGYAGYFTGGAGLYVGGNILTTGTVTANSFSGSGSNLTGITAAQVGASSPGHTHAGTDVITAVANATNATNAVNADTVDGMHASDIVAAAVPAGYSILSESATSPAGYTYMGGIVTSESTTWTTMSSTNFFNRAYSGAAVAFTDADQKSKIFVMGGCTSGSIPNPTVAVSNNDAYDPVLNTWTPLTSMPTPRCLLAATNLIVYNPITMMYDYFVCAIGGYNGTADTNVVECYNVNTGGWTTKSPLQTARRGHGAFFDNMAMNIKVFGGYNGAYLNSCETGTGGAWGSCGASISSPKAFFATVPSGGMSAYLIGGSNGTDLATFESFYGSGTTVLPSLPSPRKALAAVMMNVGGTSRIYAIGGESGGTDLGNVDEYDINYGVWLPKGTMSSPRSGLVAGTTDNKTLYAIGGKSGGAVTGLNQAFSVFKKNSYVHVKN